MASEIQVSQGSNQRKIRSNKSGKRKNKPRNVPGGSGAKVKIDGRMKKLFRKRARDYNSDDDDDEEEEKLKEYKEEDDIDADDGPAEHKEDLDGDSEEKDEEEDDDDVGSDDEEDAVQHGITRFVEGCRAFKMAFTKITKKNVSDDVLGPVLSGHKKLIAEKLAEELSERVVKGEAKKEKHLVGEKGHVTPANFLDSHEKFLIGVATKGVVKLFNAVNKAQNAQKGLNPSRFKDAKALGKRKREAFFSELRKKPSQAADSQGTKSTGTEGDDGPAWAPLRDSYMLTSSKLKNWDKMPESIPSGDLGEAMSNDGSSDEE